VNHCALLGVPLEPHSPHNCLDHLHVPAEKRAQELVKSDNLPLLENRRKMGYMRVMKDLWEEKGYGDLALTSQNLRDQAAGLEKTLSAFIIIIIIIISCQVDSLMFARSSVFPREELRCIMGLCGSQFP